MRILIFDDDKDILELCEAILNDPQYAVFCTENCGSVILEVETVNPDIIFMDYWIPPINGVEAVKLLKNHPVLKNIPVILFSATNTIEAAAGEAGADGYLKKPFDIAELERLIKTSSGDKKIGQGSNE